MDLSSDDLDFGDSLLVKSSVSDVTGSQDFVPKTQAKASDSIFMGDEHEYNMEVADITEPEKPQVKRRQTGWVKKREPSSSMQEESDNASNSKEREEPDKPQVKRRQTGWVKKGKQSSSMQEESDNASNSKERERKPVVQPSSLIQSSSSSSVAGNYSAEPEELLFSDKSGLTSEAKKTSGLASLQQKKESDNHKLLGAKESGIEQKLTTKISQQTALTEPAYIEESVKVAIDQKLAPLPLSEQSLTIDNQKVVETAKSKFQITNWRQRHKVIAPLEVIIHEQPTEHPDTLLEYNIVDQWDDFDPFSCVNCHMPFDSMVGRLPYLMPCRHNACLACVRKSVEQDRTNFDCPIDNCFIRSLEEVKENKELFAKVKTRERSKTHLHHQNERAREQIQRDRLTELNAQMSKAAADAFEKEQVFKAVKERELKDMMNGAKSVPAGADRMLQLMKEEQDMEPEPSENSIQELQEIEAKRYFSQQIHTAPQTLKRVHADDQVEIGGLKLVDKERADKLFRREPEEPPQLSQPTEIRRNHYPPGPVIEEPNKKKVYTTIKANATENNVQGSSSKPEDRILGQSKKVGNKYRLDDNMVRQIINKKYNPENENIQEQSAENTYNLSMTQKASQAQAQRSEKEDRRIQKKHVEQLAQDFDPPRENSFRQPSPDSNRTIDQTGLSYTYIMAGGKKKKKKKKKKSKKRNGDASQRSMISQESGQSVPLSIAASEMPTNPYNQEPLQFVASNQNFVFPENLRKQADQTSSSTPSVKDSLSGGSRSTQEPRSQSRTQADQTSKFGSLQPLQKQTSSSILPPIINQLPQHNEDTFGLPKPGEKNIVIDPKKPQYFTHEQLTEAFVSFDPEGNGVVTPENARKALDQVGMFVNQKIHKALKEAERTSWGGQVQVDYSELIKRIAKDPPGYVRKPKDQAVPKYFVIETGSQLNKAKDQESDEEQWTTGSKKQSDMLRKGSPDELPPKPNQSSRSPFLAQAGRQIMETPNQPFLTKIVNQQPFVQGGSEDEESERHQSQKSQVVTQSQFQKSMQSKSGKPTEDQYNQWTKLGQYCQQHPKEQIRFYCRDDLEPLCCECVVQHAKHDFISADHKAAIQVKAALTGCLGNIETQLSTYQDLLRDSSLKLQDMEHDQRRQLAKISETFKEIREQLFQRELKIKKLIHESITQSQATLRSDVGTLQQILQELISMKVSGGELRKNMEQEKDNVAAIVGSSAHVSKLHKAFKDYHLNTLSSHEPGSFVIKNEMANHPAVPEFLYNAAECRQFIDELGQIHQAANFPTNSVGGVAGLKSNTYRIGDQQVTLNKPDSDGNPNLAQLKATSAMIAQSQHVMMYQQQMPSQDNVYWPKWDSFDLFQYDFFRRKWTIMPDLRANHKFLYFSSICHLPKNLGMFILGGSDVDDNFSKRNTFLNRYQVFEDKAPMVYKRAFFPSIFCIQDSSVYVFGGNSGDKDLSSCEKYSVADNQWRQISSMTLRRNGSSVVAFQKHIFIFGGNEQDVGSLDTIEKYTIELDKWQICRLRLKEPIHDTISFNLGGNRVLIFGGNSNSQINTTFDVYDLTCETLLNLEPLETGKCYMPPVLDHGSGYLHYYVGYGDQELQHSRLNIGNLICNCASRGGYVREVVLKETTTEEKLDQSIGSVRGTVMSRSRKELMDRNKSSEKQNES